MRDFDKTVLSQYSDSAVLCQLITNINAWLDPDYDLEQFFDLIWNIDTAVGYGLDVWGRIVGVGRTVKLAASDYFGFTGATIGIESGDSFNSAPFYSGQTVTVNFELTDQAYRQLIFAKAAANITNGSIPAINYILMDLLFPGRGQCYVVDNQNMTMTYVFNFPLHPYELSIITVSNVLPTPTGVAFSVIYPSLLPT